MYIERQYTYIKQLYIFWCVKPVHIKLSRRLAYMSIYTKAYSGSC